MKSVIYLLVGIILLSGCSSTQKSSTSGNSLTFSYTVTGIIDGYDHVSKLMVYEDGKKIGESTEKKQSEGNSVTVSMSQGTHKIRAVLTALYEGKWEEHTKENEYSLDAFFEGEVDLKGNKTITLEFSIDEEKTIVKP